MTTLDDLIRQLREASEEERATWRKDLMSCGDIVLPPKLYDALRPWPSSGSPTQFNVKPATVPPGYYSNRIWR